VKKDIPTPQFRDIDGDSFLLEVDYPVKFVLWFRDSQFLIPAGQISDLSSVPKPFRPFIDRASLGLVPPLIHDFLCDRLGKFTSMSGEIIQLTRFEVNVIFLLTMLLSGINFRRAMIAFIGVCIGAPHWSVSK
jgi:Protein of unknown function (DUF1353)